MVALILAIGSACTYGVADFLGGFASRNADVFRVVAISAPASLAVELALWPVLGADWSPAVLVWGVVSGVASAAAFVLLYLALSIGPMGVLSPVTAMVSALLPAVVGLLAGERLSPLAVLGIPLAALAGALDSIANVLFLLAARAGMLTISAVVVALYPAATVLLARVILAERLGPRQWVGLGVAAVGVGLLALT